MASKYVSFITYMFLHVDIQHLASNMFVLLSVGRAVESEIGSTKFGLVFLGSGFFSAFAHVLFNQGSEISVIGASGAIFGVIAVLLLLMPFKFTSALFLPLTGVILGLSMLAIEIMSLRYGGVTYIAHDVHLYGFVAGSIASFGVDYSRAMKGLIISVLVVVALYYWVFYLNGLGI
jgi:membrane associated rhomboid family serine protease